MLGASSTDPILGRQMIEFVPFTQREVAQERVQRMLAEGKSPLYEQN